MSNNLMRDINPIASMIKSIDEKLSLRLDPICICGMVLRVDEYDIIEDAGTFFIKIHCDNPECSEKHLNKTIEIEMS